VEDHAHGATGALAGAIGATGRRGELAAALSGCRTADGAHRSVEAIPHAVGLTIGAATAIGHTHP